MTPRFRSLTSAFIASALFAAACGPLDEAERAAAEAQQSAITVQNGIYSVDLGSYSASNTASATTNTTRLDLGFIPIGTTITVSTCGSFSGDTFLRLRRGANPEFSTEVAFNDDMCGHGSELTFTASISDNYVLAAGCYSSGSCSGSVKVSTSQTPIQRFAPVLYQDTFPGDHDVRDDMITKFNFDGNYNGSDNVANRNAFWKPAHVYTSFSETTTHFFLGYYFFHPYDEASDHSNDLEGILLAVKKRGLYGDEVAMISEAHGYLYQAAKAGNGTACGGTCADDGTLTFDPDSRGPGRGAHVQVFSQEGGHGVFPCNNGGNSVNCFNNDGLVYAYEAGAVETPGLTAIDKCGSGHENMGAATTPACGYGLIALEESGGQPPSSPWVDQGFWYLQNEIAPSGKPFSSYFGFAAGGGNPPWQWDDPNDGNAYITDWLCDPAMLFDVELNGAPFNSGFSHTYVDHKYFTHSIEIGQVYSNVPRDIYANITASGTSGKDLVLNEQAWKKNGATGWNNFSYGGNDAEGQRLFGDTVKKHYFCRLSSTAANGSTVTVQVRARTSSGSNLIGTPITIGPSTMVYDVLTNGICTDPTCQGGITFRMEKFVRP
jgi:hypothetical protein